MKVEDIASYILDVESRFNVDEWTIDGIHIWPFIRIQNYALLSYKTIAAAPVNTRSSAYLRQIVAAKVVASRAKLMDSGKEVADQETDIIFLSDGISFTRINKYWYHKLCDPIAAEFLKRGLNSYRLELSHTFCIPRYSHSKFIQPQIDNIIIKSLARSKILPGPFPNENWGDYDRFLSDEIVKKNFLSIPSKTEVRTKISKIIQLRSFFVTQLRTIKPKAAFVVNFYGDDQMAFILACKWLNIPVTDIQHGVQGPLHLGYGQWRKVPDKGYAQLPDFFWVWSENEKRTIDGWSHNSGAHKALVGGNLFGDLWRDQTSELVLQLDKELEKAKPYKDKPLVLLTLSPHTESLMAETWMAVKESQTCFNWLIRLHPSMVKDKKSISRAIRQMGIDHFEIDVSSDLPLFSLLRSVDIHVTSQSSCVIEASEFGVVSVISSEYGRSLYPDQIRNNEAFFCESREDIIAMIKDDRHRNKNRKDVSEVKTNPNAAIDEILNSIKQMNDG
jgi:hypothetical protein